MFLTRQQVREVDRIAIEDFGVPGMVLMENAGRGAAELLMRLGIHAPVVICCGKGNNGGDGFVIARHLDNHQILVKVVLFANPNELSGDAAVNYHIVEKSGLPLHIIDKNDFTPNGLNEFCTGCEWVVDALFGTGLRGNVRAPFDQIIATINQSGLRVFAVDIPSGLDCNDGKSLGQTIRAEHTATFVAQKQGFANPQSREWSGQVHVVDIGAPRAITCRLHPPDPEIEKVLEN